MNVRRMMRGLLAAGLALAAVGLAGGGAQARSGQSQHERVVAFWTPARVAQAVPRDFVYDTASGSFRPAAKPDGNPGGGKPGGGGGGGGGGDTTTVLGASWTGGGQVAESTGKVLFALGSSYYVCSAAVVVDDTSGRSVILTAAHCAFDETSRAFATNWMFVPNYDAQPASLTTSGSFCAQTKYGCWTATALVVPSAYATAGGFNTTAVRNDYAFAVVEGGGKTGTAQLDSTVGAHAIQFSARDQGADSWLFGYPAAKKYKGNDLVYCRGPLGFDPSTSNTTYRVGCDMTGGSSGGPWFSPFSGGNGTLMSVNSYGYSGITAMHGPIFNAQTASLFAQAKSATTNVTHG